MTLPVPDAIPYGRQSISDDDLRAVQDVLTSDFLTQGPKVPEFEGALSNRFGAAHALCLNSATSALHAACAAMGLGPGNVLWTSPNSFVASANCARYCGADVDFVDIDPATRNMCADALEQKLQSAKLAGNLPKIVVPVHFGGLPCDMKRIGALAGEYGFRVIEDASHAVGAMIGSDTVGNCTYSDATVFSFHPVKIITTAEGGVVLSNDPEIAKGVELFRSHGVTRNPAWMVDPVPEDPWYYQQVDLGYNYRMTDLHAALGSSQLKRLDGFVDRRRAIAAQYDRAFGNLGLGLPVEPVGSRSSYHLYPICLLGPDAEHRRAVFDGLRSLGILVNVHYIPIHTQPYYRAMGFAVGDFPKAESYYEGAISLPLHPSMSEDDIARVIDGVCSVLTKARQNS